MRKTYPIFLGVLIVGLVVLTLRLYGIPNQKSASSAIDNDLPLQTFRIDGKRHIEYWQWKRNPTQKNVKNTWLVAGFGGPGVRINSEDAHYFVNELTTQMPDIDQIIVAQLRGHGASNELACSDQELPDQCKNRILAAGIDPTEYHALNYAEDFVKLRQHLKIDQWFLYGVSYSGRVAAYMAKIDSLGTRGLLLDAPVPYHPKDTLSQLTHFSRALYKFREACSSEANCFSDLSRSEARATIDRFIVRYEDPETSIKGLNGAPLTKAFWVKGVFFLMYLDSLEYAEEWIRLHIDHPKGFEATQLSDALIEAIKMGPQNFDAFVQGLIIQTQSVPAEFTRCNEALRESTFQTLDFGTYGSELDVEMYCWPTPVFDVPPATTTPVKSWIAYKVFDPVIELEDIETYQNLFQPMETCFIRSPGHATWGFHTAQLLNSFTVGNPLPDFCEPDIAALVPRISGNYAAGNTQ